MKNLAFLFLLIIYCSSNSVFSQAFEANPDQIKLKTMNTRFVWTDIQGNSHLSRGDIYEISSTIDFPEFMEYNIPSARIAGINNGTTSEYFPQVKVNKSGPKVTFTSYLYLIKDGLTRTWYPGNINEITFRYKRVAHIFIEW
ncbi:MAG: hypothetical protein E6772_06720 [Dysgonomonas sp.]|nr:hypothetical protein [Dysgonomonas sp.]